MRKWLLLILSACCAQANIFPILSDTASSGSGIDGSGGYSNGFSVRYALEQYDRSDVPAAGLRQDVYFRYSYVFMAGGPSPFDHLILTLADDCGVDTECIFGIEIEGATTTVGAIEAYSGDPGLTEPIHGIKLSNFSQELRSLRLSFFSNRIPDAPGRIYLRGGDDYAISDPGAIITPNSHVLPQDEATPEPASLTLFGSSLGVIYVLHYGLRRRRRP